VGHGTFFTRLLDAPPAARAHFPSQWDEMEIRENAGNAYRNGRQTLEWRRLEHFPLAD